MAKLPVASTAGGVVRKPILGRMSLISLCVLVLALALCLAFFWSTRDSMAHLPFLSGRGNLGGIANTQKTLVDLRPWQTAEALAPLAVTAEETEFAREAERLADHEVDQAFAAALRQANAQAQHPNLTGDALVLSQKLQQLQQLIKDDQALVDRLTPAAGAQAAAAKNAAQATEASDDLEVAKAQLGLDTDELEDAQQQFDRAVGDHRAQIQAELAAHEALMSKYDSETHNAGEVAVISVKRHGTLASRFASWKSQLDRYALIQQAIQEAKADQASLMAELAALQSGVQKAAAAPAGDLSDHASRLSAIKERTEERQLISICNDRIQTEQQLAAVYGKWSAQVLLQHRILLHLILQSLATIVFVLICIIVCDLLARWLLANPALDRRQTQTLRSVLRLAIQVAGGLCILLVVFGWPQQMSTVLGLVTAGLTIAMQDFIVAFVGWFVLMGKNGMRVGDWVEINGVGGEVTELNLMRTTLLETGNLADRGHPTGRRITFLNNFAIRGTYFNFSTAGQWMWDEIVIEIPKSVDLQKTVGQIRDAVTKETEDSAAAAEKEWKRATRGDSLSRFTAAPAVNLRPTSGGFELQVRYVTRASDRFEARNRLYQAMIGLLQNEGPLPRANDSPKAGK